MPQGAPPHQLPHAGFGIASLIVSITAFFAGIIPFVGFLGVVGIVLGIVDRTRKDPPGRPERHVLSIPGIILGSLAVAGACVWVAIAIWFENATKNGSCPHLYAWDGAEYRLDADLASGALYKGAEREDMDRLESIAPVSGEYRVRLQNDLQEIDVIDSLALVVVDGPEDADVLPTPKGELVLVRDARPPSLPPVTKASRTAAGDPRESRTFSFARPAGDRAVLVVRGRTSRFAEDAFVKYMATMGTSSRALLEWRAEEEKGCACFREYMDEEMDRMGLPLVVTTTSTPTSTPTPTSTSTSTSTPTSTSTSTSTSTKLGPIGPAISRAQALVIDLPKGDGDVIVTLESTPRFWDIDDVMLASWDEKKLEPQVLLPRSATAHDSDARDLLADNDGRRIRLSPGEHADVVFDVPPPPSTGARRTVVARLRGYYDLELGGMPGVDVSQAVAHRLGWVSLPRFAEQMN